MTTATLLLADGSYYTGQALGATTTTAGELCFNTGLTGYQEVFTDPSYYGQLIVLTHVHIGTYGTLAAEQESDRAQFSGLICRNFSSFHSRADADGGLAEWLRAQGKPAIAGVDTRALVRRIRSQGVMNAVLSTETNDLDALRATLAACPNMAGQALVQHVSTRQPYWHVPPGPTTRYTVAVLDLGLKQNILRELAARGCALRVYPYDTPAEAILADNPDGFMITNGPGDPAAMPGVVATVQALLDSRKPLMGICMGHQILALALGIPTYKMSFGHRGLNHPIINLLTGRTEITSQNHGFAIDNAAAEAHPNVCITHRHLNDNTVAGIELRNRPAFSVQYHPESCPGPHDSRYLFDRLVANLEEARHLALAG